VSADVSYSSTGATSGDVLATFHFTKTGVEILGCEWLSVEGQVQGVYVEGQGVTTPCWEGSIG
jgi:hypothetical protein